MTENDIEKKVLLTYENNLRYLKEKEKHLFDNIMLLEEAFNNKIKEERYLLEYKEGYFDIYDRVKEDYIYNSDSEKYSEEIVNKFSFNSKENSFKTFYDFKYEDGLAEKVDEISILSDPLLNNAPVVDYVNKNLPEKEIIDNMPYLLIFGVGLGLHIPKLHNLVKAKLYMIIEPSLELFRLSLFLVDYVSLSKKSRLEFFISYSENKFYEEFRLFLQKAYLYSHYIKFFYFSKNCDYLFEPIQNILVSQSHNLFAYDRELKSLNRTYGYQKNNYNFLNISKYQNLSIFENKKILLLAAGPSLMKNIEFVKDNQKKFIVVAIWPILPLLRKNNITPDIVTTYDEETKKVIHIYNELEDTDFLNETIFLFSSHLYKEFVNKIPKKNIYMFNAIYPAKRHFGNIVAPAIGEITYQLLLKLGACNIYLLGLDMALNADTGKSHYDGYYEDKEQMNIDEDKDLNQFSFRKNKVTVKGNFRNEVDTLSVYHISIKQFNFYTKEAEKNNLDINIYNLSDGAYLENVEPLRVNVLKDKELQSFDKSDIFSQLKKQFDTISSDAFDDKDVEYNKKKVVDALKLKEKLKMHMFSKYSEKSEFLKAIDLINGEIYSREYECDDLKLILSNYFKHNLHYIVYLFLLKSLNNPKRHMKKLLKNLNKQVNKIIDMYILIINVPIK
ncbi:MAG: hypothetical protein CL624_12585 [Arcobacter sp.]|nr:hypothetical protein [Arcobacter sp.]|tara:strand:+ start:6482 stop:8494 length:2013 start_codon:yes stop_codon:yes gene_type:complete